MKATAIFKTNNKTRGYVARDGGKWLFCTGKPNAAATISWSYDLEENAILCGHDYMKNIAAIYGGKYTMTAGEKVYNFG